MTDTKLLDERGLYITEKHVFFFKNRCPLSNFYPSKFNAKTSGELGGAVISQFNWTEQFFMWKKADVFKDYEIADKILKATTPKECKELGRQVRNYDELVWDKIRFQAMVEGNFYKFSQNEELKKFLLDKRFDGKTFVEASPHDSIWGICMGIGDEGLDDESNWKGKNLQGKTIDNVRKLLIESETYKGNLNDVIVHT